MISLSAAAVLAAALAASPEAPTALRKVDYLVFVAHPRASLPRLRAALSQLGQRAPSLRPDSWGHDLGEPLDVDALSAAELESAGVDVDQPITAFAIEGAQIECVATRSGVDLRSKLDLWLARRGGRKPSQSEQARVAKTEQGSVVAGYVLRAGRACLYAGGGDGGAAMKRAGEALAHPQIPAGYAIAAARLHGDAIFFSREGPSAFALSSANEDLTVDGRIDRKWLAPATGDDPFGCFASSGILSAQATFSSKYLSDPASFPRTTISGLIQAVCPACKPAVAASLANRLADEMAGPMALDVPTFRMPPGELKSLAAEYQIVQHAYLAVAKDPERAGSLIEEIAKTIGASRVEETKGTAKQFSRYEVPAGSGKMLFGSAGTLMYVGNDEVAIQEALGGSRDNCLPKGPATANVSLPAAGRDLGRLSLLDIGRVPQAAGALAVALEFGSVLRASGPVRVTAEPDPSGTRVHLSWSLPAGAPEPGR